MLRNEINNGRPVLYGGRYGSDGHAFVVDGYGSEDAFGLNLGWNTEDKVGFYVLTSSADGFDFHSQQEAVIGIKPKGQ